MSRRLLLVLAAVVLLAAVVVAIVVATGGDDKRTGLPEVDGAEAPEAYRIQYEVVTPDGQTREEHVVRRPFAAHVTMRDLDGNVLAERWSDLGALVTQSGDDTPTSIETAVALAASDLRPDRFVDRLVEVQRVVAGEDAEVGGRACRRYGEAEDVPTSSGTAGTQTGSITVTIERCVDGVGLVLEEKWTTPGGELVLTKRATELDLGDDVPDIELPDDAEPLSAEQGNGAFREVDADTPPPTAVPVSLPAPDGFTFVGRFEVVAAQLGESADPSTPITITSDVWRRGPDLLVLDQARSPQGRTPFDQRTELEAIDLPELGAATLAADLRSAEVRVVRSDGFLRLSGTVSLDELVALAQTITPAAGG